MTGPSSLTAAAAGMAVVIRTENDSHARADERHTMKMTDQTVDWPQQ
jgi:hypothetical protein